jgi:hypothetical protein
MSKQQSEQPLTFALLEGQFDELDRSLMEEWGPRNGWCKVEEVEVPLSEQTRLARIDEVKHRYVNLILTDLDEFKWKEYADKRIKELSTILTREDKED